MGDTIHPFLINNQIMPTLTLDFKYKFNDESILSGDELRALYMYGITIQDRSGKSISPEVTNHFVLAAQKEIEKYLGIKLRLQMVEESLDFYGDEFRSWGYVQTTYPVNRPESLTGYLGQVKQLQYPSQWLTSRKTSDQETYYRRIFIIPTQSATVEMSGVSMLYSGVMPNVGMTMYTYLPNYWSAKYLTGFSRIPQDIIDVVGKLASIGLFNIAGDIALGQAALANYSLSIDGLSQSVGTTNSATNAAYGARIINYQKELKDSLEKLKSYYRGVGCLSM